MTLRHHSAGNDRSWAFTRRPQDASLRLQQHGRVLPMLSEQGWWAKWWGVR